MKATNTIITSPPEAYYIEFCRRSGEIEISREASKEFPTYIFRKVKNIDILREAYKAAVPIIESTAEINAQVYNGLNSRRGL